MDFSKYIYLVDGVPYFKERTIDTHTNNIDWDLRRWNKRHANKPCGCNLSNSGYHQVGIHAKLYCVHKIFYEIETGQKVPDEMVVDHIDGDKSNNHISNLRLATWSENTRNAKRRSDNKTGVTGVCYISRTGKFAAYARYEKKRYHLGFYDDRGDAIAARAEFANGKFHKNHGR